MALGPAVAAGAFPRVPDVGRKLLGVFMRCANVFRVGETGQNSGDWGGWWYWWLGVRVEAGTLSAKG